MCRGISTPVPGIWTNMLMKMEYWEKQFHKGLNLTQEDGVIA